MQMLVNQMQNKIKLMQNFEHLPQKKIHNQIKLKQLHLTAINNATVAGILKKQT